MQDSTRLFIETIVKEQKQFFETHQTKSYAFRLSQLKKLKAGILKYEKKITDALWTDLKKSYEEAYLTEISIVLGEIDIQIKNFNKWNKPKWVYSPIVLWPSSSYIYKEPLGVSLIVSPWNYPFQLLLNPLIGAIASGCTAVLKPSPYTPATESVIEELIQEIFEPKYIAITKGGRAVNQILFEQKYDVIFFTGSPSLGKIVMKAAAENITPIVLELGGKSPCIVDKTADVKVTAKRIAWGKCINAGQTCIAPDYVFVHRSVKDEFLKELPVAIEKMYGNKIKESKYYPRIVNNQAMDRLQKLMLHGKIVYGGEVDVEEKYIAPTIIDDIQPDFPIMQEEIFGPILPVLTYENLEDVLSYINKNDNPLALYYFGDKKTGEEVLMKTSSGGGCINDTLMHIANHNIPFGGVGNSGMNKYHGLDSILAFSHERSIVKTPTWIDLPLKYAPFKYFKWIKKLL